MIRTRIRHFMFKRFIKRMARSYGFLDPFNLMNRLSRFAQPSEVKAPTELMRAGALLHARGLLNSQAIQHNLDWVWPYWVECQFDPEDKAFVPRAFSATHINLTHRNWTAVGLPEVASTPIVDPRGLVTPFWDSFSVDAWIVTPEKEDLIPSRLKEAKQSLQFDGNLAVRTESGNERGYLVSTVSEVVVEGQPSCRIHLKAQVNAPAYLALSLRPYNPEGVSFIRAIDEDEDKRGWLVNKQKKVRFDKVPEKILYSYYRKGDVYNRLWRDAPQGGIHCNIEMATAAALFPVEQSQEVTVEIPLSEKKGIASKTKKALDKSEKQQWSDCLETGCHLKIADERFQFLYDAALRTVLLHSVDDIYPGPYTYRRFWFRDAAFIVNALLCMNYGQRARRHIENFPKRLTPMGYFLSQEGEWDSNGEVLWTLKRCRDLTNEPFDKKWASIVQKAGRWIDNKRLPRKKDLLHSGLLPAGFSAEHFGPNDYYYWDDFWGVAGLKAAVSLMDESGAPKEAARLKDALEDFSECIEESLQRVEEQNGIQGIPISPYRRMDSGAVGSLVAGYPLKLYAPHHKKLLRTADFLYENCLIEGGFFHDMSHSGVNPYLTLHLAQVYLRAGDSRFIELMDAIANWSSPTGQWPEAVHPGTRGGCMGDGQHVWAAAEWLLMIRNCFVREEDDALILFSGVTPRFYEGEKEIFLGPTPTRFGPVSVTLVPEGDQLKMSWHGEWFEKSPRIIVHLPGQQPQEMSPEADSHTIEAPAFTYGGHS